MIYFDTVILMLTYGYEISELYVINYDFTDASPQKPFDPSSS